MAALFSVVQDLHPPLPDGISLSIKDFLLLCFQKEPSLRSTAAVLLKHPWLQQAAQQQSLYGSPKKTYNSPRSYVTTKSSSPLLSSEDNSPARCFSPMQESRCASAESSPTGAERTDRQGDRAAYMDTVISPRYDTLPRSPLTVKHVGSGENAPRPVTAVEEAEPSLPPLRSSPEPSKGPGSAKKELKLSDPTSMSPLKSGAVSTSLVGLFDSTQDACPVPRGVAVRRNSTNSTNFNDRCDRSFVTRMMSFELPDERDYSSGFNSLDSVDNGNVSELGLVRMLSEKQTSSITISTAPSRPLSWSHSGSNSSAYGDDEEDIDCTKVRASRSLPFFRNFSMRSQNVASSVHSEDRTLMDRDEEAFNDMRLSIDDEVDERRGLYILRKALKSSNFLDHEASPSGNEGDGDGDEDPIKTLRPPKLRLSLISPHSKEERGLSSSSLDEELNLRLQQMDSRSVGSYDGFDDMTTVCYNMTHTARHDVPIMSM